MSIPRSSVNEVQHVLLTFYSFLTQAFYIDTFVDVFSNLEIYLAWLEKIHNLLVINFKKAALNKELKG